MDAAAVGISVEARKLEPNELRYIRQQSDVLSVARPPPIQLVSPIEGLPGEASSDLQVTWGVQAVSADRSTRSADWITVAVLDTGIEGARRRVVVALEEQTESVTVSRNGG